MVNNYDELITQKYFGNDQRTFSREIFASLVFKFIKINHRINLRLQQ